jgi:hypothetical protein
MVYVPAGMLMKAKAPATFDVAVTDVVPDARVTVAPDTGRSLFGFLTMPVRAAVPAAVEETT